MAGELIAVFTTTATRDEARRIASRMLELHLVACAQISEIESHYVWQGQVQQEPECRLLLKTTRAHYPAVEAAIQSMHSYELPAIYALPFSEVSAPFADWVAAQCTRAAPTAD